MKLLPKVSHRRKFWWIIVIVVLGYFALGQHPLPGSGYYSPSCHAACTGGSSRPNGWKLPGTHADSGRVSVVPSHRVK